ncbi:MAG: hypothetical protein KGM60_07015 [Comamonadaceae bacterium]|nr:hypothetical protein [Pseudomonadota bacterium]MDE2414496.1 hypothetical protein [Comamonadaceae bacterium]
MDSLRSPDRLRWWIVAWFIFSLGATLATPVVQPRGVELVCSAIHGAALVVHGDTGNAVLDTLGMDCPLCLLGSAPPQRTANTPSTLPHVHVAPVAPPLVFAMAPMATPPPARGPPSFSV